MASHQEALGAPRVCSISHLALEDLCRVGERDSVSLLLCSESPGQLRVGGVQLEGAVAEWNR